MKRLLLKCARLAPVLLAALFIPVAVALAQQPASTALPADGRLSGVVSNGVTGQPQPGVTVILHALSSTGESLITQSAVSAADGAFAFTGLIRDPGQTYALEWFYLDVPYSSGDLSVFLPESAEITQTLSVFEPTVDPAAVSNTMLHRIINFEPAQISVVDVYVFGNAADTVFVGRPTPEDGRPETVRLGVPAGALAVNFQSPTVRAVGEDVYVDSRPVLPGAEGYTALVSYLIPITQANLRLQTPLFWPVGTVNILAADQGETITGPQLQAVGTQSVQGMDYFRFSAANLPAGPPLVLDFGGLDGIAGPGEASVPAGPDQRVLLWLILGLGAAMITFSLLYPARKPAVPAATEQARLLALLAELERAYQAGEIAEPAYQRLRQKNRTLLKQLLAQQDD